MFMKKLPYGISDYERIMENDYYYVDKTRYIEKLEDLPAPYIMFLRPRKFGKTLFTSVLENYYDVKKVDKFEKLFGETYIGKNPTKLKNRYYILRFNFSGINTKDEETTMQGFRDKVIEAVQKFINKYELDFYINPDLSTEALLGSLFIAFENQRKEEKLYVIIDEYDHFANELLGFRTDNFKSLVSKNGKVRKWYEVLKEGTESVVDRIFITGVAPITLDSMTSGFNIIFDLTQDLRFNEMMGFTAEELQTLMKEQNISVKEQKELLPIMKENYDGYKFSKDGKVQIYNSNMSLYFLNSYISFGKVPDELVDVNIASDYSKIGNMLRLCKGENRLDLIEKTVSGEGIITEITQRFNPEVAFGEKEMMSMLYYLGYLTIEDEVVGYPKLNIPNKVMKEIYSDYFLQILNEEENLDIDSSYYTEIGIEIALEGKIEKAVELLHKYLSNLSNRDFQGFDEKYVKLIFYCIMMNLKIYNVKSEMEVGREYPDLVLIPRETNKGYNAVMIEFKYLKKTEENKLKEKQEEAREQIEKYSNTEEMKEIKNLNKYTVVAINDKIHVQKI